ncbi:hypothetical protein [Sutcliffiella horikoshii]|uniref:hypothetical protein n=1 Tax=Sutcliffiella horikoshii TaxID=79883 RepID=UPI001F2C9347|nr:hypothetical protein [Sutcliffiella horikoshii]MCG1023180.1 hypothetical protein [Sutcliffiella horikoshii]
MLFWGIILIIIVSFLLFGFLLDRKTDRYKSMSDKKVKDGIEGIKDETQRQGGPPNNTHQMGP